MPNNPKKLKTFNVRKDKRLQEKKRKLVAFLDLIRKDEETFVHQKKKSESSYEGSYKDLKNELKKYQTKKAPEPAFYLADDGQRACVNFLSNQNFNCTSPLFLEDIYHLLLRSILGNLSPCPLVWAKLEVPQKVVKTVLIEIEGLSQQDIFEMHTELNTKCNMFPHVLEVVSMNTAFATELSTLHLGRGFYSQAKKYYSSLFPMDKEIIAKWETSEENNTVSRLHLLLSLIQLAMEHYPLPQSIFEPSKSEGYVFSKESYVPVTADSPMFALDCEMCLTVSGKQEVTRIAVVNENLETVYHSLVKPKEEVIDYKTKFSGVTEKMLRNVKTNLNDVHRELQRILPGDAILCGQSLNCDLHALKLIHPYVIDTSVIFNQCGQRKKKTSLKNLTKIHLKEVIQDGKRGHNPIEDSIATMKLVQLKLKNFLEFGDAVLNPIVVEGTENICENKGDDNTQNTHEGGNNVENPLKDLKFSDFVKLNADSEHDGFFFKTSRFSKQICLIGNENALSKYRSEIMYENVKYIIKSNMTKVIKATVNNVENYDCVISHLTLEKNSSISELNDIIKQAYDSFPNKTLFILFMSGIEKPRDENFKHSFCMPVLKK